MRFKIDAKLPGFGEVSFILQAQDSKSAFEKWKQVVGNPRQWAVLNNLPSPDAHSYAVSSSQPDVSDDITDI